MNTTTARFISREAMFESFKGGLVVSCQPVDGGPFDDLDSVRRFALAAVAGGANALRIEGAARLAAVRSHVALPIIGIVKHDLADSPVRITPFVDDVIQLAQAGADIIAVDATNRARPASVATLLQTIHDQGCAAMADCSNVADAASAHLLGFDLIGTTLSGYTGAWSEVPTEPDFSFLSALSQKKYRVMAEGRFNSPQHAAEAISLGAWAVTVGSAITRPELITQWFSASIAAAQTKLGADASV